MSEIGKQFFEMAEREVERSRRLHGDLASAHEAYAVLLEEVEEFWAVVKDKLGDPDDALGELIQIAAMACKAAEDIYIKREEGWPE